MKSTIWFLLCDNAALSNISHVILNNNLSVNGKIVCPYRCTQFSFKENPLNDQPIPFLHHYCKNFGHQKEKKKIYNVYVTSCVILQPSIVRFFNNMLLCSTRYALEEEKHGQMF